MSKSGKYKIKFKKAGASNIYTDIPEMDKLEEIKKEKLLKSQSIWQVHEYEKTTC